MKSSKVKDAIEAALAEIEAMSPEELEKELDSMGLTEFANTLYYAWTGNRLEDLLAGDGAIELLLIRDPGIAGTFGIKAFDTRTRESMRVTLTALDWEKMKAKVDEFLKAEGV